MARPTQLDFAHLDADGFATEVRDAIARGRARQLERAIFVALALVADAAPAQVAGKDCAFADCPFADLCADGCAYCADGAIGD